MLAPSTTVNLPQGHALRGTCRARGGRRGGGAGEQGYGPLIAPVSPFSPLALSFSLYLYLLLSFSLLLSIHPYPNSYPFPLTLILTLPYLLTHQDPGLQHIPSISLGKEKALPVVLETRGWSQSIGNAHFRVVGTWFQTDTTQGSGVIPEKLLIGRNDGREPIRPVSTTSQGRRDSRMVSFEPEDPLLGGRSLVPD